jgi:hypothetical protein
MFKITASRFTQVATMRSILLSLLCLSPMHAAEGTGPEGSVLSYEFRDAQAIAVLDAAARQTGAELYLDPSSIDTLVNLRITLKGFEPTKNWLKIFCDELSRLATQREQTSLNSGEKILIVFDIIEHDKRRIALVRREVKKP